MTCLGGDKYLPGDTLGNLLKPGGEVGMEDTKRGHPWINTLIIRIRKGFIVRK